MKKHGYTLAFTLLGLCLAYVFSGPLRNPPKNASVVGTPLAREKEEAVYAEGTITLDASVEKQASAAPVLFVMAKAQEAGPPIAVKKVVHPRFPFSFSIGQSDNMVGEDFFDGDIVVIARLDRDGAAGPKQPGDLEGMVQIKRGESRNVNIRVGPNGT